MIRPEVQQGPDIQRRMRLPERLARGLGGYALGFTGLALEFGGVASINPIIAGMGAGAVYLGHRIIEPAHDVQFGAHPESRSKLRRATRFNVSLLPTFIGASLLSTGIFGGTVNGATLRAGERIALGAVGFPILLAGDAYERYLHLGGSLIPGMNTHAPEDNQTVQPTGSLVDRFQAGLRRGFSATRRTTTPTAA